MHCRWVESVESACMFWFSEAPLSESSTEFLIWSTACNFWNILQWHLSKFHVHVSLIIRMMRKFSFSKYIQWSQLVIYLFRLFSGNSLLADLLNIFSTRAGLTCTCPTSSQQPNSIQLNHIFRKWNSNIIHVPLLISYYWNCNIIV